MKRVLKYEVPVGGPVRFLIPSPSAFDFDTLHVDTDQLGDPSSVLMWLEVDDSLVQVDRGFQVFATGEPLPDGAEHCGSVRHMRSGLVWHLYEVV